MKKSAILLTGGNAGGKTTTMKTALEPWGEDDHRLESIRADNDGRFKGTAEEQEAVLTELWLGDRPVLLIEGTRINTPLIRVAKKHREARELTILLALQEPEVMREHLQRRCEKRGKTFRADYWTYVKLSYEGLSRYRNNFYKNGVEFTKYVIGPDYAECAVISARIREIITAALGE